jgi:murein hydrolase activator
VFSLPEELSKLQSQSMLKVRRITFFITILSVFIVHSSYHYQVFSSPGQQTLDDKIKSETKKLDDIKTDIAQREAKYKLQKDQEQSIFKDLRAIEEKESELNQQLKVIDLNVQKNEIQLQDLDKKVADLNKSIEQQKQIFALRLHGLYKLGRHSSQKILLSSKSYSDMIFRFKLIKLVAEEDRKMIFNFNNLKTELKKKGSELELVNQQLATLSENLFKTRQELKQKKFEKSNLLQKIQMEKEIAQKTIDELKKYEKDLSSLLDTLNLSKNRVIRSDEKKILYQHAGNFQSMKGKLSYPVNGKIISSFGPKKHPQFDIYTQQNGIDFSADFGSPVKAVYGGTVVFANWFKSYGNLVIIDHLGGYYTLYAHLSDMTVKQGTLIEEGAIIGNVGDTGSLSGPVLYFELRHNNVPMNSIGWFRTRSK